MLRSSNSSSTPSSSIHVAPQARNTTNNSVVSNSTPNPNLSQQSQLHPQQLQEHPHLQSSSENSSPGPSADTFLTYSNVRLCPYAHLRIQGMLGQQNHLMTQLQPAQSGSASSNVCPSPHNQYRNFEGTNSANNIISDGSGNAEVALDFQGFTEGTTQPYHPGLCGLFANVCYNGANRNPFSN
jgi:hypothetical protein